MSIELTKEEAAVALSALVAFQDDDVSDAEAATVRKYYALDDAESLVGKMENAGLQYPDGLVDVEQSAVSVLEAAPRGYRLRTVAIGYQLARADGAIDQEEFQRLDYYTRQFKLSYERVKEYGAHHLREIDLENKDNWVDVEEITELQLTLPEAGVGFAALVAFRDDDLSDAEAVVMRKYYKVEDADGLQAKLESLGKAYPSALSELEPAIVRTLAFGRRPFQLRCLAIALELAEADGTIDDAEIKLIQDYGRRFGIAMYEIMHFRKKKLKEVMD